MRWTLRILAAGGVIAAMIVMGSLRNRHPGRGPMPPASDPASQQADASDPEQNSQSRFFSRRVRARSQETKSAPAEISTATNSQIADWEEKIDEVLRSDAGTADKAAKILDMFLRLPKDGQVEAAAHAANLLPDSDYPALGRYLADTNTPAGALDVLMADLLNRPNSLKLPQLLEVARAPDHPKAGDAKGLLTLYLDHDYGTNWDAWQEQLAAWLAKDSE